MKVLGYLLVLALFGDKSLKDNMKDFSIEIKKVGQLVTNMFDHRKSINGPVFTEKDVRQSNFVNKGTVAKYYSKSLRDHIVHHNVSSEEEGFVITIRKSESFEESNGNNASNKVENKIPTVIFIPTHEEPLNEDDEADLQSALTGLVEKVEKDINAKHALIDAGNSAEILLVDNKTDHLNVHPNDKNGKTMLEELSSSYISDVKVLNIDDTKKRKLLNSNTDLKVHNKTIHLEKQPTNGKVTTLVKELYSSTSSDVHVSNKNDQHSTKLPISDSTKKSKINDSLLPKQKKDNETLHLKLHPTNENVTSVPKKSKSSSTSNVKILNVDDKNQTKLTYLDTTKKSYENDSLLTKQKTDSETINLNLQPTDGNVTTVPVEPNSSNVSDKKVLDFDDKNQTNLTNIDASKKSKRIDSYSNESKNTTSTTPTPKLLNIDEIHQNFSSDPTLKIIYDDASFDDSNRYDFDYDSEESEYE